MKILLEKITSTSTCTSTFKDTDICVENNFNVHVITNILKDRIGRIEVLLGCEDVNM